MIVFFFCIFLSEESQKMWKVHLHHGMLQFDVFQCINCHNIFLHGDYFNIFHLELFVLLLLDTTLARLYLYSTTKIIHHVSSLFTLHYNNKAPRFNLVYSGWHVLGGPVATWERGSNVPAKNERAHTASKDEPWIWWAQHHVSIQHRVFKRISWPMEMWGGTGGHRWLYTCAYDRGGACAIYEKLSQY